MPIPEFNEIKVPALLWFANGDGKPHRISDVFVALADHFKLTEQERNELVPSGVRVFGWQLKKADRHREKETGRQQSLKMLE